MDVNANIDKIISSSKEIIQISRKIKDLQDAIEQINLKAAFDDDIRYKVEQAIRISIKNISNEAAHLNSMGNALELIAKKYQDTEKSIIGNAAHLVAIGYIDTNSTKSGTDKRNIFQKFWDWITRSEPDKYDTTTKEQEKAADEAMKRELATILQDEKYSQEHWDKASVEERKQILQDYMDEVIRVYGLKDVKTQIRWDSDATYTSEEILWGYYSHGSHRVTLNEQALSDNVGNWDSYSLLQTVSHELRHAYQHEAVDHPTDYMVSKETIDTWNNNFKNYIDSDDDYRGYYNQTVERDARDFEVTAPNNTVDDGIRIDPSTIPNINLDHYR